MTGSGGGPPANAGLYVHIPFCLTRCGYCDFNAYAGLGHLGPRYADAVRREATLAAPDWSDHSITTVFFGGGTPTTLGGDGLAALLGHVRDEFEVVPGAEVTTEANPDTADQPLLERLLGAGFTRLSMGVQSFDPEVLAALERVHGPASSRRAYAAARAAGFAEVNLDLIYGARGETLGSWRRTLDQAVDLGPDHLSCYALTIEPATPLGWKVNAGLLPAPDPDLQAEMYDLACETLGANGYVHYEISNWAREGFECRHNLGYWRRHPYLGLGAGAHSYRDGRRWWNLRPPVAFIEAVERGDLPVGGQEVLTPDQEQLERTFLGLRTTEGLPAIQVDAVAAARFLGEGLLARRDGRLALTDRGMFLANEVALELADPPHAHAGRG